MEWKLSETYHKTDLQISSRYQDMPTANSVKRNITIAVRVFKYIGILLLLQILLQICVYILALSINPDLWVATSMLGIMFLCFTVPVLVIIISNSIQFDNVFSKITRYIGAIIFYPVYFWGFLFAWLFILSMQDIMSVLVLLIYFIIESALLLGTVSYAMRNDLSHMQIKKFGKTILKKLAYISCILGLVLTPTYLDHALSTSNEFICKLAATLITLSGLFIQLSLIHTRYALRIRRRASSLTLDIRKIRLFYPIISKYFYYVSKYLIILTLIYVIYESISSAYTIRHDNHYYYILIYVLPCLMIVSFSLYNIRRWQYNIRRWLSYRRRKNIASK